MNTFDGHTGAVNTVAISDDGKKIVSGSDDFSIKIWKRKSGKILFDLKNHEKPVKKLAIIE